MFFRRYACHGLEPVGIMGGTVVQGPFLHCVGHHVGNLGSQLISVFNGALQGSIGLFGKVFLHDRIVKNLSSKDIFNHIFLHSFLHSAGQTAYNIFNPKMI